MVLAHGVPKSAGFAHLQRTAFLLPCTVGSLASGVPNAPRLNLAATAPHHSGDHHEPLEGKYRSDYNLPKFGSRSEIGPLGIVTRTPVNAGPTISRRLMSTSTTARKPSPAASGNATVVNSPIHQADYNYEPTVPDYSKYTSKQTEQGSRAFSYFMVGSMGLLTAAGAKSVLSDFVATLSASADVLALAKVEVDLSSIPEGKNVIIKWRGKPVFIRHRTPDDIKDAEAVDVKTLRDPQTDKERTKKPEWLVMLGVCTHLGCVPIGEAGDYNGWFCPCHGSHYDSSGRARKGPAPLNLEVPEYDFPEEGKLIIG